MLVVHIVVCATL